MEVSERGSEVPDVVWKQDPGSGGRVSWGGSRGVREASAGSPSPVSTDLTGTDLGLPREAQRSTCG